MVVALLAEIALETTIWTLKKTYNLGYYMIYGQQETTEEKLVKIVEEMKKKQEEDAKKEQENQAKMEELIKINNRYMIMLEEKIKID